MGDHTVLLGVGISSPVVVGRWHGATYGDRPIAQTREYLDLTRLCLAGDSVSFDGDFYHCSKFRLGVRLGDAAPELVLGALNQRMLRLAGEIADGVALNYLPATAVPWCVEQVRAGEAAAGRPPGPARSTPTSTSGLRSDRSPPAGPTRPLLLRRGGCVRQGLHPGRVRR